MLLDFLTQNDQPIKRSFFCFVTLKMLSHDSAKDDILCKTLILFGSKFRLYFIKTATLTFPLIQLRLIIH